MSDDDQHSNTLRRCREKQHNTMQRSNNKSKWARVLFLLCLAVIGRWWLAPATTARPQLSSLTTTSENLFSSKTIVAGNHEGKEKIIPTNATSNNDHDSIRTEMMPKEKYGGFAGQCSDDETIVQYPNLTDILSETTQQQAYSEFMTALHQPEPLTDILLVNRYRNVYGEQVPLPKSLRLFDWILLENPYRLVRTPPFTILDNSNGNADDSHNGSFVVKSVYSAPHRLKECLEKSMDYLPPLSSPNETRILAIGNEDEPRLNTVAKTIQKLLASGRYSKILIEPKNIRMDGVGSLPVGLNNRYIQELNGGPEALLRTIQRASLLNKTSSVLAAWGGRYEMLDQTIPSRIEATKFTASSCLAPRRMIDPKEYMDVVSEHRFLMAPTGNGIFTPKVMEALLVLTIPIVQRKPDSGAWEDLRDIYQWPIVIVDEWDEITPMNLVKWWTELAPKLQAGRLRLLADAWFETVLSQ